MGVAFPQLRNPNPFAYPGGGVLPGFDPNHPASQRCLHSSVCFGGGAASILSGKPGTIGTVANATQSVDQIMGPVTALNATGSKSTFSGLPGGVYSSVCLAAIVSFTASNASFLATEAGSAGWRLDNAGSGNTLRLVANGVTAIDSTLATATSGANQYFLAASANASASAFVLASLATGQIKSITKTGATPGSSSTNFDAFGITGHDSKRAAQMFSQIYLPLPQLLSWAADAWAFWYPRRNSYYAASAAFKAYWAANNNLPVLGTGTY